MFPGYSYGGANFDLTAWKLYIISILDRIEMSPVTLVLRFTFDGASAVFAFQYFKILFKQMTTFTSNVPRNLSA